jgi:hypothetical protein
VSQLNCGIKAWDATQNSRKAFIIKALSYKTTPKSRVFFDSLELNKHWFKRLHFGEEFPAETPASGVLSNEHNPPIEVVIPGRGTGILAATFVAH